MIDLKNHLAIAQSLKPAARTATANGVGVDLANINKAVVVFDIGAWTDGTHTFSVQESDDNSSFAAVVAGDLDGSAPVVNDAADDDQVYEVGYLGAKRYIRAVSTVASATTGAVYSAAVVKAAGRKQPL